MAWKFGRVDPYQLADEIPWALLCEWEAFFESEPQGEDRADWQTAVLTSAIYNTRQHWGKGAKAIEPKDTYAFLLHSMSKTDGK